MEVHLSLTVSLFEPDSSEACLIQFKGEILDAADNGVVGHANAFVLNADLCERKGFSPLDTLDTFHATSPYMTLLSEKESGNFAPPVLKLLEEDFACTLNILIIDRIEILPAYRGSARGLRAMQVLLAHLGSGCRIAAIKPYPLQFEPVRRWTPEMNLGAFNLKKREATDKLKSLYGSLGFKPVGRRGLMILDLAEDREMARDECLA